MDKVEVKFIPENITVKVQKNFSILLAAIRNKIDIRYGCAASRCGTCAVAIEKTSKVSKIQENELHLLKKMNLPLDGSVRLSCQTRVLEGPLVVDLSYQKKYSPDQGELE